MIVTVDFNELHEPKCIGADRPGDEDSDFELWTPHDGRHGGDANSKCFMGQHITYIRRKQDSECFNGEELERKLMIRHCECNEMDYECDVGFYRGETGQCVRDENMSSNAKYNQGLDSDQLAMCDTFGYYTVS